MIKEKILYMILLIISLLGIWIKVPLFFGQQYLFGGLFVYLFLLMNYNRTAILMASIYIFLPYYYWNNIFTAIIFALEIMFIAAYWIYYQKRATSLTNTVIFYWFGFGLIGSGAINYFLRHFALQEAILSAFKNSLNSVINVFLATVIVFLIQLLIKKNAQYTIHFLMTQIVLTIMVIPLFLYYIVQIPAGFEKNIQIASREVEMEEALSENQVYEWLVTQENMLIDFLQTHTVTSESWNIRLGLPQWTALKVVNNETNETILISPNYTQMKQLFAANEKITTNGKWSNLVKANDGSLYTNYDRIVEIYDIHGNKKQLEINAILKINNLEDQLVRYLKSDSKATFIFKDDEIALGNKETEYDELIMKLIHQNPKLLKEKTFEWSTVAGNQNINYWENASIIAVGKIPRTDWFLVSYKYMAPYKDEILPEYSKQLGGLMLLILFILFSSTMLSKKIIKPIEQLVFETRLSNKYVHEQVEIKWPKTFIKDIQEIINAYRDVLIGLRTSFTTIKQKEEHLQYQAEHDYLTGLWNLKGFIHQLRLIKGDPNTMLSFTNVDMKDFKSINDTLGMKFGDELLCAIAERLQTIMNDGEFVGRHSKDEFFVASLNDDQLKLEQRVHKIIEVVSAPFKISEQTIQMTMHAGISTTTLAQLQEEQFIQNAELALIQAQNDSVSYAYFDSDKASIFQRQAYIQQELRKAINEQSFLVYYQPIVHAKTGKVSAGEALLRWNHPVLGFISPGEFIPIAEANNMIVEIGELVLNRAVENIKQLEKQGVSTEISVNVSTAQLLDIHFTSKVMSILKKYEFQPGQLRLEITESIAITKMDTILGNLHELKSLGVRVSLDDFGSGYSSLNYLKDLPINCVKLDQRFTQGLSDENAIRTIVEGVKNIVHGLGMTMVAEGVEEEEQLRFFQSINCDEIQGYYYSPALPLENFVEWVKQNSTS